MSTTTANPSRPAVFALGDPVSYGLWDGRQVPCVVASNNPETGLPDSLRVSETIPFLCKKGAIVDMEPGFWDDLPAFARRNQRAAA